MGNFVDFDLFVAEEDPPRLLEANDWSLLAENPCIELMDGMCWFILPGAGFLSSLVVLWSVLSAESLSLFFGLVEEELVQDPAPAGVVETNEASAVAASITFSVLLSDMFK